MKLRFLLLPLLVLLPLALTAWANYRSVATPNFQVYYQNGWEEEALEVLQTMEYYRPYVEELTGNTGGLASIVLEDMGNEVNGYVNLLNRKIALFAYPPTGGSLSNGESWWKLVGVHEYIHHNQITTASGLPGFLQKVFGNVLYPSLHQPMWITEGITVYGESNLSPYAGRMRGGYYNTIITALAKEGKLPSPAKATVYSEDTPQAHYYVFGGSFLSYLAETYGQEKFAEFFALQGKSPESYLSAIIPALSISSYFQKVYNRSLDSLWADWQNLEANRDISLPQDKLTSTGWNYDHLQAQNGDLYYTHSSSASTGPLSGFNYNSIIRMSEPEGAARQEVILRQATDFPAGFQIKESKLYYSRSENKRGFDNNESDGTGSVTELWVKDLDSGDSRRLLSGNIRSFRVLEDDVLMVAEDDDHYRCSSITQYSLQGEMLSQPWVTDRLIANIYDWEGCIYVTAKEPWRNTSIYLMDPDEHSFFPLVNTEHMEALVRVDNGWLIFDASYEDQQRSFAYRLRTGDIYKLGENSGMRNSLMPDEEHFYTISMSARGEDIFRGEMRLIPFELPQTTAQPRPPALTQSGGNTLIMDRYPVQSGSYLGNISHMLVPRMVRIPYVMGTTDSLSLGLMMMGGDLLGDFPLWNASLEYDFDRQAWGAVVGLENNFFHPLRQNISYSSHDGGSLSLDQYLYLLERRNYGLNNVWVGLRYAGTEGFERQELNPYLGLSFRWPGGYLGTNNALYIENDDLLSTDRDRLGWQGRLNLRQRLAKATELRSQLHLAYDPDADPDEVFSPIRGYDDDWQQSSGLIFRNSIYTRLAEVRKAIWTPLAYMNDVYGGVFADASLPWDGDMDETRLSGGVELVGEFTFFSQLALDLGLRLATNKDGELVPGIILGTSF